MVVEAGAAAVGEHHIGDGRIRGMALEVATAALPLRAGGDADGHGLTQGVDGLAGGLGISVGTEVARALAVALAGVLDGRVHVAHREGDIGIALVVLEVHVEVGMVLLDEVALQHEGLVLGAHHEVVEAAHHLHHEGYLGAVVREVHVLQHAAAQVLGLPHVDDVTLGVLPQVAAGVGGHLRHLLGNGGQPTVLGTRSREVEVGDVRCGVLDAHARKATPFAGPHARSASCRGPSSPLRPSGPSARVRPTRRDASRRPGSTA